MQVDPLASDTSTVELKVVSIKLWYCALVLLKLEKLVKKVQQNY